MLEKVGGVATGEEEEMIDTRTDEEAVKMMMHNIPALAGMAPMVKDDCDYYAMPGLSSSALKAGRKSMLAMRNYITGKTVKDSPAMSTGRLLHPAILEPKTVLESMVVWDKGIKKGKAWDQFKLENSGRTIVDRDDLELVKGVVESVRRNKDAARLLRDAVIEKPIYWSTPMLGACKAKPDAWNKFGLTDVKTTANCSQADFGKQFFRLGYDLQFGWYDAAVQQVDRSPNARSCFVIVVDTSGDNDCYVAEIPGHIVADGYEQAYEVAMRYRACEAFGIWPGVTNGSETVPLMIPSWISGGELDMEGAE